MKAAVVVAWLTANALLMPVSKDPGETPEDRRARVEMSATQMVIAAREFATGKGWSWTELAAAGFILWHGETLLDRRVHAGEKHPTWTQDEGRARCLGQLHMSSLIPPDVWAKLAGTDEAATLQCARATLLVLVAQGNRCGTYIGRRANRERVAATYAAYGSGGKCVPDDRAWQRADRWNKLMASRPDRSPVKGFHRIHTRDVPDDVLAAAEFVAAELKNGERKAGYKEFVQTPDGKRFWLVIEPHANRKVGVSVLGEESR